MNIEIKAKAEEIQKLYGTQREGSSFTALVMGLFGTGKTSLICTGRKPILIDSFDPNGTVVIEAAFAEELKAGDILVRTYWNERYETPTEFLRWERQWTQDVKTGFLDQFGTYAIDSMTTFIQALANEIARKQGRSNRQLAIQDYGIMYNMLLDYIKVTSTRTCDFILTAHLSNEQDEVTGEIIAEIDTYKRLKSMIPNLFSEKYVLYTKDKPNDTPEHILLTAPKRRYRASTQLGAKGRFKIEEEADIKVLLKKAGFPTEDKPSLFK